MEPWRTQVNRPIVSSHLPSKIFAPQRISDLLTHGSYDKPHKKIIKKYTTTTTTTTTRPPIVWFPGDPDCNETAPSGFMDTFQLIAFLLSVFNIASALVANANSNNNNNNNNDNKFNGNENDLNEGNAMSETMAMNMIMPGGRELGIFEPVMTKDEKTGNKLIHFRRKRMLSEEVDARSANLADDGKVASVIMDFVNLWMKSIAANSKDCQRFHFCITNDQVAQESVLNWHLAEISSLGMAYKLAAKNDNDFKELLLAGQYGRQGLNCTKLYEDCNKNEKTFIEFTRLMPWSPVGELKHLKKLVSWVWNR